MSEIRTTQAKPSPDFINIGIGQRVEVMSEALDHALGATICFSRPNGGFFFWVELLEKIDAALLLEGAHNYRVGFQPGVKFSSSQSPRNYMRLSFAYCDEHDIERGIVRLTNAVDGALVS